MKLQEIEERCGHLQRGNGPTEVQGASVCGGGGCGVLLVLKNLTTINSEKKDKNCRQRIEIATAQADNV